MKASADARARLRRVWTSIAIPSPEGLSRPEGGSPIVTPPGVLILMESLILAQDERWRRASYMQVEREARSLLWVESGERVRNT